MAGLLVPLIFAISIWYMIEANALLKAIQRSSEGENVGMNFFSHAGRWYLIQIILGLKKIPPSLMDDSQDRLLRLRISAALGIFAFALFLYLVKGAGGA